MEHTWMRQIHCPAGLPGNGLRLKPTRFPESRLEELPQSNGSRATSVPNKVNHLFISGTDAK